ncbi:MAG: type II secretion system protein GspG [Myxococcales bacterium]|nr:type II secretion system protein GspG [Myxococcales bacterium]MCB9520046.1 type II secretion system protein GspG [Myxococcales bacterium]
MRTISEQTRRAILDQRGMTLIEIMIVLTILASLSAMIGVFVVGALKNSKIKQAETEVERYASFVEQFYVLADEWPDSLSDLASPPGGLAPLVERVGKDPWGNEYQYRKGGDRNYELCSNGPDESSGGGDDICAGQHDD